MFPGKDWFLQPTERGAEGEPGEVQRKSKTTNTPKLALGIQFRVLCYKLQILNFILDECLETSWTDLVAFIFQKLCFCSSIIVFQYGFEPTPPPTPEEEESEEEQDEDEDGLTGG